MLLFSDNDPIREVGLHDLAIWVMFIVFSKQEHVSRSPESRSQSPPAPTSTTIRKCSTHRIGTGCVFGFLVGPCFGLLPLRGCLHGRYLFWAVIERAIDLAKGFFSRF